VCIVFHAPSSSLYCFSSLTWVEETAIFQSWKLRECTIRPMPTFKLVVRTFDKTDFVESFRPRIQTRSTVRRASLFQHLPCLCGLELIASVLSIFSPPPRPKPPDPNRQALLTRISTSTTYLTLDRFEELVSESRLLPQDL